MLSAVRKKKLTDFFNILDWNKNKVLQPDDFNHVAEKMSDILKYNKESRERDHVKSRTYRLFVQLLADLGKEDECIALNDWLELFSKENKENRSAIRKYIYRSATYIFSLFDQDMNGTISKQEYQDMLWVYNLKPEDSEIGFTKLDANGDGQISMEEMVAAMSDFFLSSDPEAPGNWVFGNWDASTVEES